ncbi:hypothetical protein Zmor_019270 [Zophobas morio]|uniref:Uncharacterized protein n=1 Tax=Zophobas morio TaxID=2755281 RepID=A0AA38M8J5_9CUCU|nr:hypothetical protein Zmor_019270 [Zophobas morio]
MDIKLARNSWFRSAYPSISSNLIYAVIEWRIIPFIKILYCAAIDVSRTEAQLPPQLQSHLFVTEFYWFRPQDEQGDRFYFEINNYESSAFCTLRIIKSHLTPPNEFSVFGEKNRNDAAAYDREECTKRQKVQRSRRIFASRATTDFLIHPYLPSDRVSVRFAGGGAWSESGASLIQLRYVL